MKILILINKYICKLIVKFDKRIIIFDDGYNLIAFALELQFSLIL